MMRSNRSTTDIVKNDGQMGEPGGPTTEDAYPKMFPVNSIHARAPRYALSQPKTTSGEWEDVRDLVVKFHSGISARSSWAPISQVSIAVHEKRTHDNKPTPNPEINLPTTILEIPPVKV